MSSISVYKSKTSVDLLDVKKTPIVDGNFYLTQDRKEIYADLDGTRRTFGGVEGAIIKNSVKGEGNIVVNDSAETWIEDLNVYGKSEQTVTTGAQLFDVLGSNTWVNKSFTTAGVTFTLEDNGYVSIKGTSTGRVLCFVHRSAEGQKLGVGEYTVSMGSPLPTGVNFVEGNYNSDKVYLGNVVTLKEGQIEKTFSLAKETGVLEGYIEIKNAGVTVDYKWLPMLNKGTTAKPYEPFTGGQPSPSPSYPQPIVSVGDKGSIKVDITGKNLFDYEKYTTIGLKCYRGTLEFVDNGLLITATDRDSYIENIGTQTVMSAPVRSGQTYELSWESNNKLAGDIYIYPNGKKPERLILASNAKVNKLQYTATEDVTFVTFRFGVIDKGTSILYKNIMFRQIDTNNTYETYRAPQSLTINTPNGLNGIKVARNGNYIDSKGQHWNTDEIDFANGKVIKRVDKLVIDGTNIKFIEVVGKYWNLPEKCCKGVNNSESISNFTKLFRFNIACEFAFFSKQEMLSYFATVDELNAYCVQKYNEGNPIVVYYCINPIEHPLSETEIAQFRKLHTNYPTTVLTNDCGADMEIEYVANTKNYISEEIERSTNTNSLVQMHTIYENKDITDFYYNGTLKQEIAKGDFSNVRVGNYIIGKVTGTKWLVVDGDIWMNKGSTPTVRHHLVIMPEILKGVTELLWNGPISLGSTQINSAQGLAPMNTTNTTEGAYANSYMKKTILARVYTEWFLRDFGENCLNFSNLLDNAIDKTVPSVAIPSAMGRASAWAWENSYCDLPTMANFMGYTSEPSTFANGCQTDQFALFKLHSYWSVFGRTSTWTKDVVSDSGYGSVGGGGYVAFNNASQCGHVRPFALIT